MARYLDPKADVTFKRIFADHPKLLISFLNALLPFEPGRRIETIEYLPSEQPPDTAEGKNSIVDVRCKDNFERKFIVEMQVRWSEFFRNRIVFNSCKSYVRQLDKAEKYLQLQPIYTLAILNSNFDHETTEFYHHFKTVNVKNIKESLPGQEYVLVELRKFKPEKIADKKMAVLWLRFLTEVGEKLTTLPEELKDDEHTKLAAELCEVGAFTPEELARYDAYWDGVRTQAGIIEEEHAKGKAEGLTEGEAIGLEKGEAIGETKSKTQIAKKMLSDGMSIDIVSKYTGLTKEEVQEIINTK
jgi:predicted transposase/invertase (TIGR01784 family)